MTRKCFIFSRLIDHISWNLINKSNMKDKKLIKLEKLKENMRKTRKKRKWFRNWNVWSLDPIGEAWNRGRMKIVEISKELKLKTFKISRLIYQNWTKKTIQARAFMIKNSIKSYEITLIPKISIKLL